MVRRLVLALKDTDRDNEFRPLRMKNGRLLVRLVNDPTADEAGVPGSRAVLPEEDMLVLMASESESDEKLEPVKGADSIMEMAIVGGLDGIAGFLNHASRHEDGGADEIEVTGLSGKLADPQPVDIVGRSYAKRWAWLMLGVG